MGRPGSLDTSATDASRNAALTPSCAVESEWAQCVAVALLYRLLYLLPWLLPWGCGIYFF